MLELVLLAIPAAFAAWTIVQEEIFRDFREWAKTHSNDHRFWVRKLAYLPTCYYCTGTWTSAAFLLLNPVRFVSEGPQGYLIAWFTIAAVSQVYLTAFNMLRVALRWSQAKADAAKPVAEQPETMKVA